MTHLGPITVVEHVESASHSSGSNDLPALIACIVYVHRTLPEDDAFRQSPDTALLAQGPIY